MKRPHTRVRHLCFAFVTSLLMLTGLPAHAQLDILLTNDDGFGEPGIEALKTQLRAAGHTVTVGAPDGNVSGSATSLDSVRPFYQVVCEAVTECKVRAVCVEVVTVPASCSTLDSLGPATSFASVLATSAAVGKDPADFDLIVSGINSGSNVGPDTVFSGTVGAVIASLAKNGIDTPAIAISTVSDPVNTTVDDVAAFVASLIAHLESAKGGASAKLLPDGVGLNINYPDLAPGDVAGVMLTVQGRLDKDVATGELLATRAVPFPPLADDNVFFPNVVIIPNDDTEIRRADTTEFENGFITITPLEADYTAVRRSQVRVGRLLEGFAP